MMDDTTSQIEDLFSEVDSFLEQKKVKESASFKDDLLVNAKDKWTDSRTNNIVKSIASEFAQFEKETVETAEIEEEKIDNEEAISELEKMIGTTSLKGLMDALKDKEVPTDKEVEEKLASTRELNIIPEIKEPQIEEKILSIDPEIEKLKEEFLPEELDTSKEITIFNNEPETVESMEEPVEEKTSDFVSMFIDDVYEDDESLDDLIEETESETVSENTEVTVNEEEVSAESLEDKSEESVEEKTEEIKEEPKITEEITIIEDVKPEVIEHEEVIIELDKLNNDDESDDVSCIIENIKSAETAVEESVFESNKIEPVIEKVVEEKKEESHKTVTEKKTVQKNKKKSKKDASLWVVVIILAILTLIVAGIVLAQFVKVKSQVTLLDAYVNEVMILEDKIRYLL